MKIIKAAIRAQPHSMDEVIPSLLKAMNRMAKDHNQQPQAGFLGNKGRTSRESPTENEYGSGSWFVYHALDCEFNIDIGL